MCGFQTQVGRSAVVQRVQEVLGVVGGVSSDHHRNGPRVAGRHRRPRDAIPGQRAGCEPRQHRQLPKHRRHLGLWSVPPAVLVDSLATRGIETEL